MKANETKKQQNAQTQQKDQAVVRVNSQLRAGTGFSTERHTCI